MSILAVNAGSSSLKFSLHSVRAGWVQAAMLSGSASDAAMPAAKLTGHEC